MRTSRARAVLGRDGAVYRRLVLVRSVRAKTLLLKCVLASNQRERRQSSPTADSSGGFSVSSMSSIDFF